jgi:23S rRNA (uracil1939-C5)-methyltransferase
MAPGPLEHFTERRQDERVVCAHADRCGGCPLIGLTYGDQLDIKRGRVAASASRYPSLALVPTAQVAPATPVVGYRSRAKLIVGPGGELGLFAKGGGHTVIDIPQCLVISPRLAAAAAFLRARIGEHRQSIGTLCPFDPETNTGALRAIDLRETEDQGRHQLLLTLVMQHETAPGDEQLMAEASHIAKSIDTVAGIAVNYHVADAPQILGPETRLLWGQAVLPDRVGASVHHATFGSFVQAHRGQSARVHAWLAETLAKPQGRVLDLYGGSGAIALAFAARGANVHLIEAFAPAAENARAAAKAQGLALTADAQDVATALRHLGNRGEAFDLAVVNPPRRGISPVARQLLARLGPETIAYVSCDPDTLARDLDHFARLGYQGQRLSPLDMIPLTEEVETVAILTRGTLPPLAILYQDDGFLLIDKAAHQGMGDEDAQGLLGRVRREVPGFSQAESPLPLDASTSGLVPFVRDATLARSWAPVLAASAPSSSLHPTCRRVFVIAARGITPTKGAIVRELREDGRSYFARTRYRRLAVASGHSVLRVVPEQPRPHQIRRHMAAIGHPVLGDERYGHAPTNRFFEEKNSLDRTFLHCVRYEFDHPLTAQKHVVESPLPGDLRGVLERTSGAGTLRFLDHKNALGTSNSTMPPPPDSSTASGLGALDLDLRSPSLRPELTSDDDSEA